MLEYIKLLIQNPDFFIKEVTNNKESMTELFCSKNLSTHGRNEIKRIICKLKK